MSFKFEFLGEVGCPRNNQIFFRFEPKQTETQSVSVCFAKPKNVFFGLFRCFGPALKQPKQTEQPKQTRKIFKKRSLLRGPQNREFFFRLEPKHTKTQSVLVVFRLAFSRNQQIFLLGLFLFVSMFQTGVETTKTNRTYSMGN
jgi:hypothetical protein